MLDTDLHEQEAFHQQVFDMLGEIIDDAIENHARYTEEQKLLEERQAEEKKRDIENAAVSSIDGKEGVTDFASQDVSLLLDTQINSEDIAVNREDRERLAHQPRSVTMPPINEQHTDKRVSFQDDQAKNQEEEGKDNVS